MRFMMLPGARWSRSEGAADMRPIGEPAITSRTGARPSTARASPAAQGARRSGMACFPLWISPGSARPRRAYNLRLSAGTSPHMRADLWQRGCERLAAELPDQQFNTWIRPLPDAEVADLGDAGATVTIRVPNRFKLDWIRTQYAGRIETVLSELAGKPVRLDVTLAPRDGARQGRARRPPPMPARRCARAVRRRAPARPRASAQRRRRRRCRRRRRRCRRAAASTRR